MLRRFTSDRRAVTSIEYVMIAAYAALAFLMGIAQLGTALGQHMTASANAISAAMGH